MKCTQCKEEFSFDDFHEGTTLCLTCWYNYGGGYEKDAAQYLRWAREDDAMEEL